MNEYEIAVIEAAQDLVDALEGGHYGPGQAEIAQAEKSLLHAIADLQAANDGRWIRPKETAAAQMDDDPPYLAHALGANKETP